ncbi:cysteine-rich CWC family protein [Pelomonas aquatica]|jgi:hypothetical protein|uniref:Cysteine-rich CWC family protein n=1 Tax=Pelomonas aquatica TaxID=431058 RepID=A0A9X4R447_9BURK|nr:cysteine-rich CWC family protein [Pelomonas aquatica]MCY4753094.1 cysteine-rich CWC family protein [Pelomonas aquatica]MDG0862842.1 hypothetical protein [Pelomonas aquatica]
MSSRHGPMLDARCPRCCGGFECGAQAGDCACNGIHLTDSLRTQLAARYSGCLCLPCLRELIDAEAQRRGQDARQ